MKRVPFALLPCVLFAALASPASALQITVQWPPQTHGSYRIIDDAHAFAATNETGTYPAGGKSVRLVGSGFDLSLGIDDGKVVIPKPGLPLETVEVRFDPDL